MTPDPDPTPTPTPTPTPPDAAEAVERLLRDFLAALERRDLPAAAACLAPGVGMEFPGGVRHASLEAMAESARGRYRRVGKRIDAVEVWPRHASAGGGHAAHVAYVFGTLHGENLHGVPFEGVRFVDRFEVVDGRITDQRVYNDLAESGVLTRRA